MVDRSFLDRESVLGMDSQNYRLCTYMGFLMLEAAMIGNFTRYPLDIRDLLEDVWPLSGRPSCIVVYITWVRDAMYQVELV